MLTTDEIHRLIAGGPAAATGTDGKIEALRRFAPKNANGYPVIEPRFVAFFGALGATAANTGTAYRHPGRQTRAATDGRHEAARRFGQDGAGPQPLSAADVAWISGLPPADQVTYADAVELARLAAQVAAGSADQRLVLSKWAPVRSRHDRAEADAQLAAARRPWPAVPEQAAVDAMLAALETDPQLTAALTEQELRTRARDLVADAVAARDVARRTGIEQAERVLAHVQQERTEREAVNA